MRRAPCASKVQGVDFPDRFTGGQQGVGSPKIDYIRKDYGLEPENTGPLEKETRLPKPSCSGSMLIFGGVTIHICWVLRKVLFLACSHMFYMNLNANVLNYQWRFPTSLSTNLEQQH